MKRRKLLAIFCAASLSVGLLAGCGEDSTDKEEENSQEVVKDEEVLSGFTDGEDETAETDEEEETGEEETKEAENAEDAADTTDGQDASDSGEEADGDQSTSAEDGAILDTSEPLTGLHHAEIEVEDYGTIKLELDADTAPITVTNFVKLAQEGFYDGLTFHRIMDGFMIQGGDPLGTGTGGSDETIKGEFESNGVENTLSHVRGTVSMARSSAPDSASSQFFIVQADSTYLDGDYAAFGTVTEGMEVVDAICKDADPTDNNGTIPAEEQPVMASVTIID